MAWAGISSQWPNENLPVALAELNFIVKQDAELGITPINISIFEHDSGYGISLSHGTITIPDLTNDPNNCGTVGNICEYNHAEDLCVNGECSMGACEGGYYNLNNNPADGCEYACTVNNAGIEICDGIDNDCDGLIDNGNFVQYSGMDEGECRRGIIDCVNGQMQEVQQEIGPVVESCDNKDNNCDGLIDEGFTNTDGDGEANCVDLDDDNDGILDADEIACGSKPLKKNSTCEVCDGQIDEGVLNTYYKDADGDTYGDANSTTLACTVPDGYAANANDCDDTDADKKPLGNEACDGKDNDCDGQIDEGVLNTYYKDADGDTYGDANSTTLACSVPVGYAANANDCDDTDTYTNPNGIEICDGKDNDCDGQIDEGVLNTYYKDADNDTYGDADNTALACTVPDGYVANANDCDDTDADKKPLGNEACDGKDNDCDGQIDEGVLNTYYKDADGDTYGDAANTALACSVPVGYVANDDDCDDADDDKKPLGNEVCDNKDNDCNGEIDEVFDLQTDPSNCGACGVICQYENALGTCEDGICIMTCEEGYYDFNNTPDDGCEYDCLVTKELEINNSSV